MKLYQKNLRFLITETSRCLLKEKFLNQDWREAAFIKSPEERCFEMGKKIYTREKLD